MKSFFNELINKIKKEKPNINRLIQIKMELCKKYNIKKLPTNSEILLNADKKDIQILKKYLQVKPVRTISGVAPIAIMTKPFYCPHGKCIMCPGGPSSYFGNTPQSYTGKEPATRRAIRNKFDPYLQIFNRLEQYICSSHYPGKVELIIMGGTFLSFPKKYRETFIAYSFKAMNDFSKLFFKKNKLNIEKFKKFFELPGNIEDEKRTKKIQKKLLKLKGKAILEKEQRKNENSTIKCVALCIETRPDYGKLEQGNELLKLGCTRVELGVQTIYNNILKKIKRGHLIKDSIEATRILKDLGFKITYHMMLGLPSSSFKKDLNSLKEIFSNSNFRPDMLKIYPCMVLKGTKLYNLYKKGKYKPLTTKQAAKIIIEFKKHIPEYCRISRIQRDIPTYVTEAGVNITNLRQYILNKNIKCRCIRCREAGKADKIGKLKILIKKYNASKGKEFFISLEDIKNDLIIGFCRLRKPSQCLRKEINNKTMIVRELHVYGAATEIGKKGKLQHKGYGKKLLLEAEKIAKKNNCNKIIIISGVGVKPYYFKLGYKRDGPYVSKYI